MDFFASPPQFPALQAQEQSNFTDPSLLAYKSPLYSNAMPAKSMMGKSTPVKDPWVEAQPRSEQRADEREEQRLKEEKKRQREEEERMRRAGYNNGGGWAGDSGRSSSADSRK